MPTTRRKSRSSAQIREILTELKHSGLSQREFALRRNLPLSTLTNWLRKHRTTSAVPNQPEIIPVGRICDPSPVLEIEFPGGEILRIGNGCLGEDLRTVLAELRRC